MSISTTTQTMTVVHPNQEEIRNARLQATLGDYAIRTTGTTDSVEERAISGRNSSSPQLMTAELDGIIDPTTEPHPRVEGVISPNWWPENWRRIPEYAPINRHLNIEARPAGANPRQTRMLTIVLNGCALISVYAYIWRNTLGSIHDRIDKIFHYEIGGEY